MKASTGTRLFFETDRDGKARPEWAVDVLTALNAAGMAGFSRSGDEPRLTSGEQDLLDAIGYRLRGRLGENAKPSYTAMADVLLESGMAKIAADSGVYARNKARVLTTIAAVLSAVAATVVTNHIVAVIYAVSAVAFCMSAGAQWRNIHARQSQRPKKGASK